MCKMHSIVVTYLTQIALSHIWTENFSHLTFRKVKPMMEKIEGAIRGQS